MIQCDLPNVKIDTESLNAYCRENNLLAWFPTSAKDDINIGIYQMQLKFNTYFIFLKPTLNMH